MEATPVTDMPSTSRAKGHHRRQKSGGSERQVLAADDHEDEAAEVWQSLWRAPSRSRCLCAF